jgi:carbonic anhydrase/acetyltransferase-like protein (isoleucine patch superfamily)
MEKQTDIFSLVNRVETGPSVGKRVFIAKNATVIGETYLADDANVWFHACLRADIAPIYIGKGTNVQDSSIFHVGFELPVKVGDYTTIGHNVNLHGCTIGSRVLVGIGAVVLDGAVISDDSIVAAGTLVPPGKTFPSGVMIMGNPAKVTRELQEKDYVHIRENSEHYMLFKDIYIEKGF